MSGSKQGCQQKIPNKLPKEFYLCSDVVLLSKNLLGKFLVTFLPLSSNHKSVLTSGMIVETEAYAGIHDKASHAYNNRFTKRTKTMYENGGIAYVYLCYGIHSLFNIVTNKKGIPDAILIRAIQPVDGIEFMLKRRKKRTIDYTLTSGPGSLTEALGITTKHNGVKLDGNIIWLEERGVVIPPHQIVASPRIGVAYAEEDAMLPYRFQIKDNPWVSK